MPEQLTEAEDAVLRNCLRTLAHLRGGKNTEISAEIASMIDTVSEEDVAKFINRQSLRREKVSLIAPVALDIVFNDHMQILRALAAESPALANYALDVLRRHHPRASELPPCEGGANTIFENWQKSHHREDTNDYLSSGIYQIFMRHKPLKEHESEVDQVVVVELAFIDSVARKCVLVGSDRQVHYGTLHINAQSQAFFLYQGRHQNGFSYRFYCLRLEGQRDIYPSMSIRIGDQSNQPVASDCFSLFVGKKHAALYAAFKEIGLDEKRPEIFKISEDSVILDYIAPSTREARAVKTRKNWQAKSLKDFPFLLSLATNGDLPMFREPIRAVLNKDLAGQLDTLPDARIPDVFQHSKSQGGTATP